MLALDNAYVHGVLLVEQWASPQTLKPFLNTACSMVQSHFSSCRLRKRNVNALKVVLILHPPCKQKSVQAWKDVVFSHRTFLLLLFFSPLNLFLNWENESSDILFPLFANELQNNWRSLKELVSYKTSWFKPEINQRQVQLAMYCPSLTLFWRNCNYYFLFLFLFHMIPLFHFLISWYCIYGLNV